MAELPEKPWFVRNATWRMTYPVHWKGWLLWIGGIGFQLAWVVFWMATGLFQKHPTLIVLVIFAPWVGLAVIAYKHTEYR